MGEYYANGYGGRRQPAVAAELFCNAAIKGESQVSQHLNIYISSILFTCIMRRIIYKMHNVCQLRSCACLNIN